MSANLDYRPPRGTIIPHLLLLFSQIFFLSSPRFHGRRFLSAVTIGFFVVLSHLNSPCTNDIGTAQFLSLAWPHYLSTLTHIIYSTSMGPEADLWRVDQPPGEALTFTAYGFRKIKWAILILLNLRGIRWSFQVKNIPLQKHLSRPRFLLSQFLILLRMILMSDLLLQLGARLFYPELRFGTDEVNSKFLTLAGPTLGWSFVKTLIFGCGPYFFINMQYITCAIIAVGFGFSHPHDWPPFFGELDKVITVRDFWGKFWHQSLRKVLNTFSGSAIDALQIPRGTNWSSYGQIFISFLVSGTMHALSILMLPSPSNITVTERTLGMFQFFMWQAVAISIEDFAKWLAAQTGVRERLSPRSTRWLGRTWVVLSFWFSLPFGGDIMLRVRLLEKSFLPFSIVAPIMPYVPLP